MAPLNHYIALVGNWQALVVASFLLSQLSRLSQLIQTVSIRVGASCWSVPSCLPALAGVGDVGATGAERREADRRHMTHRGNAYRVQWM